MRLRHVVFSAMATAVTMALASAAAQAQDYPNKPIRLVTVEAGGGNDSIARLIGLFLSPGLGQNIVVDNRGGANGVLAVDNVAKAAPDGYTLLSYSGAMWTLPFMRSVPYDSIRDFSPISLAVISPNVLVVHPSLPVTNVRELSAYAKAKPGELNYASVASGSSGHLTSELFKSMAGVDIVRVLYKGGGPAMTDLVSGRVQVSFSSAASAMRFVQSGKLRALAVSSIKPSTLAPGVPPVAIEGLPGFDMAAQYGLFAPAKTPTAIINRLHQETVKSLNTPQAREQFIKQGTEVVASSPQELAALVKNEQSKLGKLIKDAGITSD